MPGPHAHLLIGTCPTESHRDLSALNHQQNLKVLCSLVNQTSINTYTWNLEKWYWRAYLQGRNREADMENRLEDTAGKERVGWISRVALRYVHYHVSATQLVGAAIRLGELSLGLCDVPEARGRGWMYTESWFALLYSRNQHNGKQFPWIKKKKVLSPELQMCLFDY